LANLHAESGPESPVTRYGKRGASAVKFFDTHRAVFVLDATAFIPALDARRREFEVSDSSNWIWAILTG
jgi:hypothetical protein